MFEKKTELDANPARVLSCCMAPASVGQCPAITYLHSDDSSGWILQCHMWMVQFTGEKVGSGIRGRVLTGQICVLLA